MTPAAAPSTADPARLIASVTPVAFLPPLSAFRSEI